MNYRIPISKPWIDENDVTRVATAIRRKKLSMGSYTDKFEKAFAKFCGTNNAVATCNGTAALHLATLAVGIGPRDEVIVPSFSFVASSNCVLYTGATPVFADIEPSTYNIDPADVAKKITNKTKAIIVVHYAGQCADMKAINEIAERYQISVIEDAAEAHGSEVEGKKAGNLGNIGTFSFYPNKNMTTGEGGMVTTNSSKFFERLMLLRSHGQIRRYVHEELGYNYRMTDIQAALGLSQMKKLQKAISKKNHLAAYYNQIINEQLNGVVEPPFVAPGRTHTYMFYTVRFFGEEMRNQAIKSLERNHIETRVAFPPIHRQPQYLKQYSKVRLPQTEKLSKRVLSLPIFVGLSARAQDFIVKTVKNAIR